MNRRGPLAWMVDHGVAPNLLMVLLIAGGLLASLSIKKELFPDFEMEIINVSISYPGATPEDIEQSILLPVEAALADVEGIDELTATANEGSGRLRAELTEGINVMRVYQDIQQAVDAITILPEAANPPRISLSGGSRSVLSLQVYGQVGLSALHDAAENVRAELLAAAGISRVEVSGDRDREIQIHLDEEAIQRYGIDHQALANLIGQEALDLASGQLSTREGEWLVRYQGRRNGAEEFADLPVITSTQGAPVRLGDIARVQAGFAETDREVFYNGEPALSVNVYQVGNQTPTGLSGAVQGELERLRANLPDGVSLDISRDTSEIYQGRLDLLLKNAWLGLTLVMVLMALFLQARLAFWVTLGIPIAFLGALLFLPWMGVSLNMISMFAFIIALGIVVDDAIMVGENIYSYREQGYSLRDAAVLGAREIATPLTFAILSNIVAFLPLLFLPGFLGLIFATVPMVVITVFLISWVEALFILPNHLAHSRANKKARANWLDQLRQRMQAGLHHFTYQRFEPFLQHALNQRLLTISIGVVILALTLAWAMSGRLGFSLMPRIESDQVQASVTLPIGSPISLSRSLSQQLLDAADTLAESEDSLSFSSSRTQLDGESLSIRLDIAAESLDDWPPSRIAPAWRELSGDLVGAQSVRFESDVGGPGSGAALSLRLSHPDTQVLESAAERLATELTNFGLIDVDSGLGDGKPQLEMRLSSEGRALGLTGSELARALRGPLQGATAIEQFSGRSEVSIEVRLPPDARDSLDALYRLPIQTPEGLSVPLSRVAEFTLSQASSSIQRIDGRRIITVTADSEGDVAINQVLATLREEVFPNLQAQFSGLEVGLGGRQQDTADNLATLRTAMWLMLGALYSLMAIPFRSYTQPLLVLAAIPFGIVGAMGGHVILGFGLSIISLLGMLALSGVVINDALVLIDYANRKRREGMAAREAIVAAATRRLRPIMMTTLTTFLGLAPMMLETSRQARFMIPMAISLGFGMLFATLILLVLVPCLYLGLENMRERFTRQTNTAEARP
ncbi:efflux RND transporter permease subunit [Halomonas sp. TBZ9]|uniref:Efflux RND transporter permease subunit n=1 Tax=Vreelandella azerica TaxID=2732867 RepID=A0A7Y3TY30_9GAMM|nr:efflux RND transporter permease subunit [Halomonas azerica]NOG31885.1 efflux RND transporter permease subunit [Halomonas azerica]